MDGPQGTTPLPAPAGAGASRMDAQRYAVPAALLILAAVGWWWSVQMATSMSTGAHPAGMGSMGSQHATSLAGFLLAWLAMMTAMMFPAISPVVKLYGRAAAAGRVAPLPFFVGGYIAIWTSLGLPAYLAWRALMDPIAGGRPWAARLAGGTFIVAAVWQLTPLKSICLRHCRSPMSVFMRAGASAARPLGATRMGATHGAYCIGCCWAFMVVLVALGTMNLAWMLAFAALILLEKNAPGSERIALVASAGMAALGATLIVQPTMLSALT